MCSTYAPFNRDYDDIQRNFLSGDVIPMMIPITENDFKEIGKINLAFDFSECKKALNKILK